MANAKIVPNASIGKVGLGMTFAQVKKVLGPPGTVNKRAQLAGHRGYIEYGWNFSTFWVGFINTKGHLSAWLIGVGLVGQKTSGGVGVGTSLETLKRQFHVQCNAGPDRAFDAGQWYQDKAMRLTDYCLLGRRSVRHTIFALTCANPSPPPSGCDAWKISAVVIRERTLV
jgi:hypothetical protein